MSVMHHVSQDGKRIDIKINGDFCYHLSQSFREAYRHADVVEKACYHIDLSETTYLDSAALGMLLLLREHAKNHAGSVVLENPAGQVVSILKSANFEQLFRIQYPAHDSLAA